MIRIEVPAGRPITMNEHRRLHHHARAKIDAMWRQAAWACCKKQAVGTFQRRARITVVPVYSDGSALPDPGAAMPAAKAAIDGIVDAGLLVGDTGRHVAWIKLCAPEVEDWDGLVLLLEPEPAREGEPDDPTSPTADDRLRHPSQSGWRGTARRGPRR